MFTTLAAAIPLLLSGFRTEPASTVLIVAIGSVLLIDCGLDSACGQSRMGGLHAGSMVKGVSTTFVRDRTPSQNSKDRSASCQKAAHRWTRRRGRSWPD